MTAIRTGLGLVAIAHRRCATKAALLVAEDRVEPDAIRAGDVCWLCNKPLSKSLDGSGAGPRPHQGMTRIKS